MICRCGNETSAWLCPTCVTKLEYLIVRVDAVVAEVRAVVPRLTLTATYGDRAPGVRAQHAPAPVSVDAVSSLDALQRWMLGAALRLAGITRKPLPGKTHELLGSYLLANMPRLATLSWAPDLFGQLEPLVKDCENAANTDRTPRVIVGPCETIGCLETLNANEGDRETRCLVCTQTYDIATYRARRAHQALGHDGTPLRAAQAVRYLNSKGVKVNTKDVENWVKWGHLTETSTDDKGRRLYNIEDIYTNALRNAS